MGVYLAQQLRQRPQQRTRRNSAFSKPCSPSSSLRLPPAPPPQHPPPPSVVVCWEAASLVVPAMTRRPRPRLPPPPRPPSVEGFLEGDFFADTKENTIFKVEDNFLNKTCNCF